MDDVLRTLGNTITFKPNFSRLIRNGIKACPTTNTYNYLMNNSTKQLLYVQCLFLIGCSSVERPLTTELNNSYQQVDTGLKEDNSNLKSSQISSYFISEEWSQNKNLNFKKQEALHGKNQFVSQDKQIAKIETFSVSFDPEKARDIINNYRKEKKLKPLKLNSELTDVAKLHSKDLSKWDRISHYGSDGSNPTDRLKKTGYNFRVAVENVGSGTTNFEQIFDGWTKSPGQNKNLLLPEVSEMGLALIQNPKTEFKFFWTLILAAPI